MIQATGRTKPEAMTSNREVRQEAEEESFLPTKSGDPITVNETDGNIYGGSKITALESGNAVVIWTIDGDSFGQIVSADGEPIGSNFELPSHESIAALSSGGFVIAWGEDGAIYTQTFDNEGAAVSAIETVTNHSHSSAATVHALSDGGFLVGWTSNVYYIGLGNTLGSMGRIYNQYAQVQSNEIQLSAFTDGYHTAPEIAPSADGGFAVVYSADESGADEKDVFLRFFDSNGNVIEIDSELSDNRIRVNSVTEGEQFDPDIALLNDGLYVVTWTTDQSELGYNNTDVMGRIISSDGSFVSDPFVLNTELNNNQSDTSVYALGDGGFIAGWSGFYWRGQRFDSEGNKLGEEILGSNDNLAIFDGRYLSNWSHEGIHVQAYDFVFQTVQMSGSDADDRLTGTTGADVILADSGNDTVSGGAGADSILGGDGADVLRGNAGGDTINGGDGNDVIWAGAGDNGHDRFWGGNGADTIGGGAGSDLIVGEAGPDVLFGGTGYDTLVGGEWDGSAGFADTSSNSIWAGEGNDVVYGASAADQLGGGDGDDYIAGAGGNDIIYAGRTGDDTLDGGAGDDIIFGGRDDDVVRGGDGDDELYGGRLHDVVEGGAGNDSIYGGTGNDTLTGGEGDDIILPGNNSLSGAVDYDLLIFAAGHGSDIVSGFSLDEDQLDLSATSTEFIDLAAVQAAATDTDEGVLIDTGGGNSILLTGITAADLIDLQVVL
ncbi:calcium-binding protein [Kordiimonas lipolytica]|nr:calcium-binding protein [Kordiimonas lipolytica]